MNLKGEIGSLFDPCINAILTVTYGGELLDHNVPPAIQLDLRI